MELFKSFFFDKNGPAVPAELERQIYEGRHIVEIDEKLFFHIKFVYRSLLIFDSEDRYALRTGERSHEVAEFFCQGDRYFLRPPQLVEN